MQGSNHEPSFLKGLLHGTRLKEELKVPEISPERQRYDTAVNLVSKSFMPSVLLGS